MRRVVLILVALVLMLCISVSISYIWSGLKWDENPTYYISNDLYNKLAFGAEAAVQRAARTWSGVANFQFNYGGRTWREPGEKQDWDGYSVVGCKDRPWKPDPAWS